MTSNDWVLVMRNGSLVIGIVLGERERDKYPWGIEYITTVGVVGQGEIVECRSGQAKAGA